MKFPKLEEYPIDADTLELFMLFLCKQYATNTIIGIITALHKSQIINGYAEFSKEHWIRVTETRHGCQKYRDILANTSGKS